MITGTSELDRISRSKSMQKTVSEMHYTRDTLLGYLEEARELALDKGNPTAVVSATMGMARVLGLIIDRREVGEAGAFDALTDEELMQEAVKRARELGIAGPHLVEDKAGMTTPNPDVRFTPKVTLRLS
jgi:hypothetical protein